MFWESWPGVPAGRGVGGGRGLRALGMGVGLGGVHHANVIGLGSGGLTITPTHAFMDTAHGALGGLVMLIVPNMVDRVEIATPGWPELSPAQFRARVVELLPFACCEPVEIDPASIDEVCVAGLEFGVGPYDCACEILDRAWGGE